MINFGSQMGLACVTSTALTIPTADPLGVNRTPSMALVRVEGASVRYRDDGTAPTASVGMNLNIGDVLKFDGDLTKLRFIQQSATATLNVIYYG